MLPNPNAKQKPFNVPQALAQALDLHGQGRLLEADALYALILAARPDNFDALQMRGLVMLAQGRLGEALRLVGAALQQRPSAPQVLLNYGIVLDALKRHEEALASFEKAIGHKSKFAEAHNNRGGVLVTLGRDAEALESLKRALAIKPGYTDALCNQATALKNLGRFDEALKSIDRALTLTSNSARAHNIRGTIFEARKDYAEALACYDRALAIDPRYSEPLNNRGVVLRAQQRYEDALASFDRAIALDPSFAQAYYNRGAVLLDFNRCAEAVESYDNAVRHKPDFAEAKLGAVIANLPVLYRDEDEIAAQRARYAERLRALHAEVMQSPNPAAYAKGVGPNQPFYLAYQGQNDRGLQRLYGETVCRIMAARFPAAPLAPPPAIDEPLRVGVVSGFFYDHSNWKIPIKGWLSELDRTRFQLFGYHTGSKHDRETDAAAKLCARFVEGTRPLEEWRTGILRDAPHVLIIPEVGMDAMSVQLAAQRLARVQCTSWGHPETSGFPTLDYFFSSDLMEPADGQDYYSEKLVRLPNLSIYYEPVPTAPVPVTRAELGLRDGVPLFWCGQSMFKYLPQYDGVFARIAREIGDCQFAFLAHQGAQAVSAVFRERLAKAFTAQGLSADNHCVVLPRLGRDKFAAAIGLSDVVLDSIGWAGCNSTLEGLHYDMPVVTMDFGPMRGRHGAAIFRMMDVTDTVTQSIDDYVATAVRLARDGEARAALKGEIAAHKKRLYRDRACITALEDFLEQAGRGTLSKI